MKLVTRLLTNYSPRRGRSRGAAIGLVGILTLLGGGCGLTEMDISLADQMFTYDLMNTFQFPLPKQGCAGKAADFCQTFFYQQTGIIDNRVKASCDPDTVQCVADLTMTIVYIINVAQDPAFTTGFAQSNSDNIRDVTINYTITNNSDFNIDKIDVYIGPNGIMSPTDAGIESIGELGPVIAGGLLTQNQQPLVIADNTPAHDQVIANVNNPDIPFNFLMQSTIRFKGGDLVPAGQIIVDMAPVVKLLRR